jgi:hypothetical protein
MRFRWPCLLSLALALSATPARADAAADISRARELFLEGSKLAEAGDWEGARERYERSLKLKYAALTVYNLGIAQQETGHLVDAIESFRAFLALSVEPATQQFAEQVRTVVPQLEARLARVEIDVRPAGVQGTVVRIDGREVPADPGPRAVDPGHHDISVSAPGFCSAHHAATLPTGTRTTIPLELTPGAPEPPSVTLPLSIGAGALGMVVGGAVLLGVGGHVGLSSSPDTGATKLLIAGGSLEGAGALALGTAAALLLVRSSGRSAKSAVAPWSSGNVAGVRVRF